MRLPVAVVTTLLLSLATQAEAELVGYWKFDDNVLDHSEMGNNGTATNLAYSTNVPSAIGSGKSGYFDDTAYVTIADDATLNSTVFTLALWINQDGNTQDGVYERLTSRQGYSFETAVSSSGSEIRYFPGYGAGWQRTGYNAPSSGWTHIAFVSDGTSMTLYVDGTSVYSGGPAPPSLSGTMKIGASGSEEYKGLIDDVALWNQALGQQEIAMLANGVDARSIPEPATFVLLALATLTMLGVRRRKGR